jgi:hypothetical protein
MTLQNVKLLRTNRLLKIDTDNLIKLTTQPLEQKISELTLANVRLQRANKLLQLDVDEKAAELNRFREEEIIKLKSVGPEYEYLVQMINLLHRQVKFLTSSYTLPWPLRTCLTPAHLFFFFSFFADQWICTL